MSYKIGIFAGTFDPIHNAHLEFASAAARQAGLEKIFFLAERRPRQKTDVTAYATRLAMLKIALKPLKPFSPLDLPDTQFNVRRTLPKLQKRFKDYELSLLLGSDILGSLHDWPDLSELLASTDLIIGLRGDDTAESSRNVLNALELPYQATFIRTQYPGLTSAQLRQRPVSHAMPAGVAEYIKQHGLYN